MQCPNCRLDNIQATERCVRCGVPLALREEPTPQPLDRTLDIDRRDPVAARGPSPTQRPELLRPFSSTTPPPLPATRGERQGEGLAEREGPESRPGDPSPDIRLDVGAMEIHLRRAPSWKRATAWAVDGVALGLFGAALIRLAAGATRAVASPQPGLDGALELAAQNARLFASLAAVLALASFVYLTLGHALMGATFGKRLLRIRVVARDGKPPTLARSAARSAVALASLLALGLGPLLALFTRSGRALHDFLAGTYVVELP